MDIPTVAKWLSIKPVGYWRRKPTVTCVINIPRTWRRKLFSARSQLRMLCLRLNQTRPPSRPRRTQTKQRLKQKPHILIRDGRRAIQSKFFWGQANEPGQIVPLPKFLQSAKTAMGCEVFEQEPVEPRTLVDEPAERVGVSTIEKLKAKMLSGAS